MPQATHQYNIPRAPATHVPAHAVQMMVPDSGVRILLGRPGQFCSMPYCKCQKSPEACGRLVWKEPEDLYCTPGYCYLVLYQV